MHITRLPIFIIEILLFGTACQTRLLAQPDIQMTGWRQDYIGPLRGDATISLGAQFFNDYFHIRNLIVRSTVDISPGVRLHIGARRREGNWQQMPFHPEIDEAYIEGSGAYRSPTYNIALNLKIGRSRYLRFPEPDRIAYFDQVTGIEDFSTPTVTDYRGAIFAAEAGHRSGFGAHFTGIQWGFDSQQTGANAIEWYGFYRRTLGSGWNVEMRLGALAGRVAPLGGPARQGQNALISKQVGEFEVGALYEKRRGDKAYTGIMVRFKPTAVTRALGAVGFDYARTPEGFAVQYDLYRMRVNQATKADPDDELVGEVKAVRIRTYWEQSYQRNEYEHRISSWGERAGRSVYTVVKEEPWRLDTEALVSPHVSLSESWFTDRQGPAYLMQDVTYSFYRRKAH